MGITLANFQLKAIEALMEAIVKKRATLHCCKVAKLCCHDCTNPLRIA